MRLRDVLKGASFKEIIDATLTASAAMIVLSLIHGGQFAGYLVGDLIISLLLLASGVIARIPAPLLIASSIPVYSVDLLASATWGIHVVGPLLLIFRLVRIGYDLKSIEKHTSIIGREVISLSVQAGVLAGVMLLGGSLALYVAERTVPSSPIHTYWDALWASIATTTTVGYGDVVPVSGPGRMVAAMLMIFGVAYITFLITNMATILVKLARISEADIADPIEKEKYQIIERLRTSLQEIDDEEFHMLMAKLNTIRIIQRAEEDDILGAFLSTGGYRSEREVATA